jgi:hypothetical protein
MPDGAMVRARSRSGALTFVFAPAWLIALALMPFAQSGETFGSVRRVIKLWRHQLRNSALPGKSG